MARWKLWLGLGLVLAAVAVAAAYFLLHQPPDDIVGWDRAAWGMTQAEAAKIYQLEPWDKSSAKPVCRLKDGRKLAGEDFAVYLYFDQMAPAGKLREVTMMAQGEADNFAALVDEFAELYGPPSSQENTFAFKNWQWKRPSGSLSLMIVAAPEDGPDPLDEEPRPTPAKDPASCSVRFMAASGQ